jgi:hypothetical protein
LISGIRPKAIGGDLRMPSLLDLMSLTKQQSAGPPLAGRQEIEKALSRDEEKPAAAAAGRS